VQDLASVFDSSHVWHIVVAKRSNVLEI